MPDILSLPASKLAARLLVTGLLFAAPPPAFAAGGGGGGRGGGMGGGMGGGRGGIGGIGGGQNVRIPGGRGGARGFAAGAPDASADRASAAPDAVADRATGDGTDRVDPGASRGFAGGFEGAGFGPDRVGGRRQSRRLALRELRIRTSRCDRTLAERNGVSHGCSGSSPYGSDP